MVREGIVPMVLATYLQFGTSSSLSTGASACYSISRTLSTGASERPAMYRAKPTDWKRIVARVPGLA